jgi:hypothetical protein
MDTKVKSPLRVLLVGLLAAALIAVMAFMAPPAISAQADEPTATTTLTPGPPDYLKVYWTDLDDGSSQSAFIYFDDLDRSDELFGYEFQRSNINNVVATDDWVFLDDLLYAALESKGYEPGDYWTSGSSLSIIAGGQPYDKWVNGFTFDQLSAQGYFFPDVTATSAATVGTGTKVPTIIALNTESHALTATDVTAGNWLYNIADPDSGSQSPRLLLGYPDDDPTDIGGFRYPSEIDAITIVTAS